MIITNTKLTKLTLSKIRKGAVFIFPTDTIYGLGCNATNMKSVARLRRVKSHKVQGKSIAYKKPLSIIAPSKKWIRENCEVDDEGERWLKKLPGKITLVFKLKNKKAIAPNVSRSSTVGIRMPEGWFYKKLKIPIIATSVNKSGRKYMTSLNDLSPSIKKGVDFIIYRGKLSRKPSKVYDLIKGKVLRK